MKKLVAFTAALSLASSVFVLPTVASAAPNIPGVPNNGIAAYCSGGGAALLGVSQGNCVQIVSYFLVTGGLTPNANAFCNYWQAHQDVLGPFNFPSFGACASAINAFFHS
jgi:hypothetical protein